MHNFDFTPFAPAEGHVLCLKSLATNLVASHNDFKWPESGKCSAPDWKPTQACGNGLHAFLWGAGDSSLRCDDEDAKWLVMSVEASKVIDLEGKVKFPECDVLFCGERETAIAIIQHFAPAGTAVMFGTVTGGDAATVTGGYAATVTGGDDATVTGGNRATVTGGNRATVTGGDDATVTGGLWSVLVLKFWNDVTSQTEQRCALVDGVNYLPGMKYKLSKRYAIEAVNDTEA